MATDVKIKVLYVETDRAASRAVELFLQGFTSNLEVTTVASTDEVYTLPREGGDVILIDTVHIDEPKRAILERLRNRFAHLPLVDLGAGAKDNITRGSATTVDEFFPKLPVGIGAVLRSASHLLERRRLETDLEVTQEKLKEATNSDSLTGLWNRKYIATRLDQEFQSSKRYKKPLTVCLFEIAGFKAINETYGFEIADNVLAQVGEMIRQIKRNTDLAGRFGEDTFCIVFHNTAAHNALVGVERFRDRIRRSVFTGKQAENFTLDVSFGVVELNEEFDQLTDLLITAGQALRKAKTVGGGAIEVIAATPIGAK